MEKIANLLKAKRLEAGLTIEEVSDKTRLTTKHIKALEAGDMEFFKDDLSYLRFFLHSYCNAVGLDFEEIKPMLRESIDDYTMTFTKKVEEEHDLMEKSIEKKAKNIEKKKTKRPKNNVKHAVERRHVDLSLISLIVVVAVVVLGIAYVLFTHVLPNMGKDEASVPKKDPVVETPKDQEEQKAEKDPEKEVDAKKEVMITMDETDPHQYVVSNLKAGEALKIEITFQSEVWFQLSKNATALNEPASKVYTTGEHVVLDTTVAVNDVYTLRFGNWANAHEIKVNGESVKLDQSVLAVKDPQNIILTMKGE